MAAGDLPAGRAPARPADRARAWKLGDTPDAGRLAALAAALGLGGRPVEEAGGWTLRAGRRGLMAHRLAGVPWTYEASLLPLPLPSGPVATARPVRRPAELAYLLPAYLFDLKGGWTDTRPVLAVPHRYLTR